jgi:hypothetical protein
MSVTVIAKKTVGFKSPYTGDTFQDLTQKIIGRDGYMSGGVTTDDGANITVGPVVMVQRGIIAETEVDSPDIAVPTEAEPWYLVAALPDDDPLTGVVFSVTRDLVSALNGSVIAFKTGGVWQNPPSVDIRGASAKAAEPGVETGAQPYITLTGDNMDEIVLNRGRIVDPDGLRRDLPRDAASSAKNFSATAVRAHPTKGRMDHVVLRQREGYTPETKHLIGPLFDDSNYALFTKTGTRMGYYAKRGGTNDEQWFAWGDGTDLRVMGGPAGGGFADAILLSGGAISNVWIAGQRAADDALIVLYTDGILLRMASFQAGAAVVVDGPITLDLDGQTVSNIRAELDDSELIHIVYERDDGGAPTQQVYYTRRATAAAQFAVAAITHRIVHGSPTGKNDTYPDIDVDRHGNAHIVYTSGILAETYGDLAYAMIDQAGNLAIEQAHTAATAVGQQASSIDKIGFVATAYDYFQRARVTVTDFDEVFCAMSGDDGGGSFDDILFFSPGFSDRLGFAVVDTGTGSGSIVSSDIESNELGELRVALVGYLGGVFIDVREIGFDTVFAQDGLLAGSVLRTATLSGGIVVYTPGTDEDDIILRRGTIGDVRMSHRRNASNAGFLYEIGTQDEGSASYHSQPHPKDLYLASFDVADDGGGAIPSQDVRLHNVRPKKMNYPFLVGIDGDFQGFDSIHRAVSTANINGGEVVVRKGDYRRLYTGSFAGTLALASGVSVRGEGQVLFGNQAFSIGSSSASITVTNIDGNVIEAANIFFGVRPGDVVEMLAGSGFHRVLAVLPPKGAFAGRLLLDVSSPAASVPSGASFAFYPSGNKIENIAFSAITSAPRILIYKSWQAVVRDCSFFGEKTGTSSTQIIDMDEAYLPLLENLDFTKMEGTGTQIAVHMEDCFRPTLRGLHCTLGEVDGIDIRITNDTPRIVDCTGIKLQNLAGGSRTTPVLLSGADDGLVAALDADTDIWTHVGSLLVAPFNERLAFQDKNTLAEQGPLALTAAGAINAALNGATPTTIVPSINERVKKTGDTMSGALTVQGLLTAQDRADIGANLLGSIANADVARITTGVSVFAGVEYTLIEAAVPSGEKGYRRYVGPTGTLVETINASYNNTTNLWAKDVNGEEATRRDQSNIGPVPKHQVAGVNSWADAAWSFLNFKTTDRDNRIRNYWGPEGYMMGPAVQRTYEVDLNAQQTTGQQQYVQMGLHVDVDANTETLQSFPLTGEGWTCPVFIWEIQDAATTEGCNAYRRFRHNAIDQMCSVTEFRLMMDAVGANGVDIWLGLRSDNVTTILPGATWEHAGIQKRSTDTNWQTAVGDRVSGQTNDTGVPPVADVFQTFRIEYHGKLTPVGVANGNNAVARFFIDGVSVAEQTGSRVPESADGGGSAGLALCIGVFADGTGPVGDFRMKAGPIHYAYNEVLDPIVPEFTE